MSSDLTDFRYRTELPEGAATVTVSLPDGSDSDSSLESSHTGLTMNIDDLSGMLRSHSQIIEVNCMTYYFTIVKREKQ